MKDAPGPGGAPIVITAILTFAAGVFLARGETNLAVAMLIVLVAAWVLAAVKSA
jgi:hypothetical protein